MKNLNQAFRISETAFLRDSLSPSLEILWIYTFIWFFLFEDPYISFGAMAKLSVELPLFLTVWSMI